MRFAELCSQRGLEAPEITGGVPQLAQLVLDDEKYVIPVFAGFSAYTLPLASFLIENEFDPRAVLSRLSVLAPLLPSISTLVEYFLASQAWDCAQCVPAIIRLLLHDYRRYAIYFKSETLRQIASDSESSEGRVRALVALGLLMERSEGQIGEWLTEFAGAEALTKFEFEAVLSQAMSDSEDKKLLEMQSGPVDLGELPKSHLFTDLVGVFVPRLGGSEGTAVVVEMPTFMDNLRRFAAQLLTDQHLLLVGDRGSGKTTLVETVHERVRSTELVRIHLGDQTDAKALVGNYTTGSKPGTFEWTPGALTSAVQRGQWVLIEEIDRAPNDIVSVLLSLLTRRELVIPSRNQVIRAAPGFKIVATTTSATEIIGERSFARVLVDSPTNEDLSLLVRKRKPFLSPLAADMFVTVFRRVEEWQERHLSSTRLASTRDLVKLVNRVSPEYSTEDMFREAVSCFTSYLPDPLDLARAIGEAMNIADSQVLPLLTRLRPQISMTEQTVVIGRAQVERRAVTSSAARSLDADLRDAKFALTLPTLKLMEEISVGIQHSEPVLLVGETGTGKTTVVQHLAKAARRKLVVINVSQQVEAGDLVGGYKPVDARQLAVPLLDEFHELFDMTFSRAKNHQFLEVLEKTIAKQQWKNVVKLLREAVKMATKSANDNKRVRRESDWTHFPQQIDAFEARLDTVNKAAQFQFVEGLLVRALRQGHWVLLDELNLAPADTVEGISELLSSRSLTMLENAGAVVHAHEDFRLFANMNPATDVGKKDLPMSVRTQLTELWSASPDSDLEALRAIIARYLPAGTDSVLVNDVAQLYTEARHLAETHQLVDGSGQRPHFSIRTLSRMLISGVKFSSMYGLRRALYETFIMSFLTLLDDASSQLLAAHAEHHLLDKLPNRKSVMSVVPPAPGPSYVQFQHWWMPVCSTGANGSEDSQYILTQSVERNLLNLVRATALKSYPVLIQGPTSSGKTSMISYLAKRTGHTVVRINNHEHTDLAEYMGGYESDSDGALIYKEGALVTALRKGYWLVLDELNLAPTDVLEALNRLLDDNRELLVPETQEIVKPHKDFVLFATQNPPGIYAGRKVLSRAFRNRFLELHFGDIPENELEQIVRDRTQIAPSYAAKIVEVYRELARQRIQRVFEQTATLRDLFRWAQRPAIGYEELAFNGYCLLAERSRTAKDRDAVKQVIEKVMRVTINTDIAALADENVMRAAPANIVWTRAMRRVLALVQMAVKQNEPVLLVGETGCGKTTIIQTLAAAQNQNLLILNAHQNTETGDLVGSQRPVRSGQSSKLFEWVDGPLVCALKSGSFFLLDEISLADDSVLERLNSVLEPERQLFVPEIGAVQAEPSFEFFSTMNPGGDYGKKELSPALRNRFTEIWVPTVDDESDLQLIVSSKLTNPEGTQVIVEFSQWFSREFSLVVSLRDILSWAEFVNQGHGDYRQMLVHGAFLTFIDGLGIHANGDETGKRRKCVEKLAALAGREALEGIDDTTLHYTDDAVSIGGFSLPLKHVPDEQREATEFSLAAPTSALNAKRVVRAMQVRKPVLLEGSPGAGKTSLIAALARLCGAKLTRINLSDQTDLSDLFGQDVPLEEAGKFGWRTAPFLRAMQEGEWVLLDEMNLAPQPVLEGLNACLDHRGEAYIPELDRKFVKHKDFTVFAAQNPQGQGGGRKGLPKSFVNRFSVVYVDQLGLRDLHAIAASTHPSVAPDVRERLAEFVEELATWSSRQLLSGGPFEFNLRDTLRWLDLVASTCQPPQLFLPLVVTQRLRSPDARLAVERMFAKYFDAIPTNDVNPVVISPTNLRVGAVQTARKSPSWLVHAHTRVLPPQIPVLETALQCVCQKWPLILVGASGTGKTSIVQLLAQLRGTTLREFAMTPDIDSTDLLGEFDQLEIESEREQMWSVIAEEVSRLATQVSDSRLTDAVKTRDLELIESMDLPQSAEAIRQFRATDFSKPMFKWVDGMLVRAVEQGDWLVLDNANLCSAAVLDRLNSLLERGGYLAVNECANEDGSPREIRPHKNFRLFLTVNPKYGELSRAMRNRGVEVFLGEAFQTANPTADELSLQFAEPLTLSRLADLHTRTWLRSLVLNDQTTPKEFLPLVDSELARFAASRFSCNQLDPEFWLKFEISEILDQAVADARAWTTNTIPDSLLVKSALRRLRDIDCEFDVYGLLLECLNTGAGAEVFSILRDLAQVTDPSRIAVYRDWLVKHIPELSEVVKQSLGPQYDFKDGGAGMERIWQSFGRPVGFTTKADHDNYLELLKLGREFDDVVANLGLDFTDSIAQIRLIMSQAVQVDELVTAAIQNFRESVAGVSSRPVQLVDAFATLWKLLALVYAAQPSPKLFAGIAGLTSLANLSTSHLRALAHRSKLCVPDVCVPESLETVVLNVLQMTQQGQAVSEVLKIVDIVVDFSAEFTRAMHPIELVDSITQQAWRDLGMMSQPASPLVLAEQLLYLYVCPLPMDPAIAQHVWYERYTNLQREFQLDEQCWYEMQQLFGSDSSVVDEWLHSRTLKEQPVPSIWRPQQSGIQLVHRDMVAVAQLVMSIKQRQLSVEESALVLRNAEHLYSRLTRATGYRDLVAPVLTALALLKLHLTSISSDGDSDYWLLDPVVTSTSSFTATQLATTTSSYPLLVMENLQCAPAVPMDALDKVIESVHQTWTMDRLKLEEQQREQNSGVRYIDGDEDEQLEREFQQMFPDYDESSVPLAKGDTFVPDFVDLYCRLLNNESRSLTEVLVHAANKLTANGGISSETHLPALILALQARSTAPKSSSEINFYLDPSPVDADLSVRFAETTAQKVRGLLELWPEHATLQVIARVAAEVIDLPPGTPVAFHLSKVEQLNHNLYEWDRFASKEHKVGDLMAQASSLIVRWRQLELATWPALFLVEKRKASDAAAPFWFHLYETLVFAPVDDLASTAKVLVLFMSESAIGQFHRRLELLRAFEKHLALKHNDKVQQCVANVRQYFEQFSTPVQTKLDELEKQLKKKVDEVVKLASWRDVNIHALKQSAQRSHRQLFKSVKKFRELLLTKAVTSDPPASTTASFTAHPQAAPSMEWVPLTSSVALRWHGRPERLKDLSKISGTLDHYIAQVSLDNTKSFYEMANDIELRTVKLKQETPAKRTKENKKVITALKVEKQQLLTETLRELRSAGLKTSVNRATFETQLELTRVLAIAPNLEDTKFSSTDSQFYAFIELLPKLRAAVSDAATSETNDVPIQDLQRGLALAEDVFSHLLRLRKQAAKHASHSTDSAVLQELVREPVDASYSDATPFLRKAGHLLENVSELIEDILVVAKTPSGLTTGLVQQAKSGQSVQGLVCRTTFASTWLAGVKESITGLQSRLASTRAGPLLDATLSAVQAQVATELPEASKTTTFNEVDETIVTASNSVLVIIQQIVKLVSESRLASDAGTEDDRWFVQIVKLVIKLVSTLRSAELTERFNQAAHLILVFSKSEPDAAAGLAASLMVFIQSYERLSAIVENLLLEVLTSTTVGGLKLAKLLFALATSGFCSPQPTEDDEDDQPEKGDGTGLGDGQGGQSSSKDLDEDDDDVAEAMQSANPDQEEREDDGEEDKAKEMEGDMEGQLEDAPPQNSDDEENEDDDDEMDEEVGNLDDLDPNAVDEKMWDDQRPDTDEKEKQTDEQVDGSKNADDEAEAGNDNQKDNRDQQEDGEEAEDGSDAGEEEDAQDDELGGEKKDDELEEGTEQKDALDLPDDMQLDGDEKDDDGDGMDDDMDAEDADSEGMDEVDEQDGEGAEDGQEAEDGVEDGEDDVQPENAEAENADAGDADAEEGEAEGEDAEDDAKDDNEMTEAKPEDMNIEQDDGTEGDGQGADIEGLHGPTDQQDTPQQDQATSTENRTDSQGQGASEDASGEQSNLGMGGTSGAAQEKSEETQDQHDQQESNQIKESLKQLGDAMEKFHRRQQAIREHEERAEEFEETKSSDPDRPLNGDEELEHVGKDDAFDTQALGKSDEKQQIDDDMAIDDDMEGGGEKEVEGDEEAGAEHGGRGGETTVKEEEDEEMSDAPPVISANVDQQFDEEEDADEPSKVPTTALEATAPTRDDLWQVYESKTHDLALMLGEQLRLILEPTVASKLRGDYRTGKRLNMKRIIPYIASEFRKDKIWLRRTKPAKREYQILLALDDSKSMGEPAVVDLAFQAIALVGKALGSIEAGQVGVARFGSTTEFVHPLDRPLTVQTGNNVLSQFHFDQERTNVHELLARSLDMFREHSTSSSEQWKLEIIVSDGITDDHAALRKLVRQAYDERVMVVFVVLDALNRETSVLDMNEVRYTSDAEGNPKLEVVKYFEDFPFDYYVIVRNIGDLPLVLANVLRQYFQAQQ